MKHDRGFRIPEPRDRAIRWPARAGERREVLAVWDADSLAWFVPGSAVAYGDPLDLVHRYGNDWFVVIIDRAAEAR